MFIYFRYVKVKSKLLERSLGKLYILTIWMIDALYFTKSVSYQQVIM